MANSAPGVLSVKGLTVAYGTGGSAVSDVSLTLRPGEFVGLTGPSGSGKSTLALALLGLTRENGRIVGGRVLFENRDLLTLSEPALEEIRGRHIAYIAQNPRASLHPMYPVGAQISRVLKAHGAAGGAEQRAVDMLRQMGINDPERRAGAFVHELSGGMAQRALIALALSTDPRLVIADEPTSGLDVTAQAQFLDALWQASRAADTTLVLVTQERGILANYCDRVLALDQGRVVSDTGITGFLTHPATSIATSDPIERAAESAASQADKPDLCQIDEPILCHIEKLRKTFAVRGTRKKLQALDSFSLSIVKGKSVGLVGESGSGKSTLGRCLLKLLEPDSGSVVFAGRDLSKLRPAELRRIRQRMQFVRQDPFDSFDPRWDIERSLVDTIELHNTVPTAEIANEVKRLLAMVGVADDVLGHRPKGLSAGVLQRIAIARALATRPDFLVLDEPTSLLSPHDRQIVLKLLMELHRQLGLTYLLISHDLTSVAAACHRVAVMYLGQMVELGSIAQVFENPVHPYTKALIAAHLEETPPLRRVDGPRAEELAGDIPSPIDLPEGCYLAARCPQAADTCKREAQKLRVLADRRCVRCWRADRHDSDNQAGAEASPSSFVSTTE